MSSISKIIERDSVPSKTVANIQTDGVTVVLGAVRRCFLASVSMKARVLYPLLLSSLSIRQFSRVQRPGHGTAECGSQDQTSQLVLAFHLFGFS